MNSPRSKSMSLLMNGVLVLTLCLVKSSTYGLANKTDGSTVTVSQIVPSVNSSSTVLAPNTNESNIASATLVPPQTKPLDNKPTVDVSTVKVPKKDAVTPAIPSPETVSHDSDDPVAPTHSIAPIPVPTTQPTSKQPTTKSTTVPPVTPNTTVTSVSPNVISTTNLPSTSPPTPHSRQFDGPSFVGGIILTTGLLAISFVAFKFYRSRTEQNYHTL